MILKIALLSGDGIGPEVSAQAVKCLQAVEDAFGHRFRFQEALIGQVAMNKTGDFLPPDTLALCRDSDAVMAGYTGNPKKRNESGENPGPEEGLRRLKGELGLFSEIRPVKVFPTLIDKSPLKKEIIKGTDFVIYRELTGGAYSGPHILSADKSEASDLNRNTESEINRIAHLAFKAAKARKKKLCLVDKASVLETSRLWRRVVGLTGRSYPEVTLTYMLLEEAVAQFLLHPAQFDVVLTENMIGDMLSAQAGVLGGSIGLLPAASLNEQYALFEPVQGSYAGSNRKNAANPIASILSAAMLTEHFGLEEETRAIVMAVYKSMKQKIVTRDLDPKSRYSTENVGDFIANNIVDDEEPLILNKENIGLGKSTII